MSSPWDSGHSFVRRVFTSGISWVNRVWTVGAFCGVAWVAADNIFWSTVLTIVMWSALAQLVLYDVYTDGWVAGKRSIVEAARIANSSSAGAAISVVALLDLCERHDVPMEEVAQLIWKDKP